MGSNVYGNPCNGHTATFHKENSEIDLLALPLLRMSERVPIPYLLDTGLSLIVGTFVELSILQYLTRRTRPKSTNTTIQVDEIVLFEHAVNLLNGPMIFVKMLHFTFHMYTEVIFGNMVFSSVWKVFAAFVSLHRAIGGLGIAGVRVLCISFPHIVLHIGAKRMVKLTCGLTFSLSLMLAIGITVEIAVVAPEIILNTFRNHKPIPNRYLSTSIFCRASSSFCLLANVGEFICYVIIFVIMYKQHKRHVRLCLSQKPKLAQKKKRRNTVTAVGHFTSWTIEILIFGFLIYIGVAHKSTSAFSAWACWLLGFFAASINYVIFPSVQAMTSEDLRDHVFSVDRCKDMFSFINCKFKRNEQDVDGPGEGIELQP